MKIIRFRVEYKGLENKIWREIEVTRNFTWAELGYLILATFDMTASHLFEFRFGDLKIVMPNEDQEVGEVDIFSATLNFDEALVGSEIIMNYDYGTTQVFKIKILPFADTSKEEEVCYPRIAAGAGQGILEDVPVEELQKLVSQIDKTGKTEEPIFYKGQAVAWDYRNYDIELDNKLLREKFLDIADAYQGNF